MHIRMVDLTIADDGNELGRELVTLRRTEAKLETIGITLAESKQVLQHLQEAVVKQQVEAYLDQQRACPHCGKKRRLKQSKPVPFRTLFGRVEVSNPRWWQCNCRPCPPCQPQTSKSDIDEPHTTKTVRPLSVLLHQRTSPELLYLETKWASLAAYRVTTELLHEVYRSTTNIALARSVIIPCGQPDVRSRCWGTNKLST